MEQEKKESLQEDFRQKVRSALHEREAPPEPWAEVEPDKMNRKVHITLVGDLKTSSEALEAMKQRFSDVRQIKGGQGSTMYAEITDEDNPGWEADAVKKFLKQQGFNIAGEAPGQTGMF